MSLRGYNKRDSRAARHKKNRRKNPLDVSKEQLLQIIGGQNVDIRMLSAQIEALSQAYEDQRSLSAAADTKPAEKPELPADDGPELPNVIEAEEAPE